MLNDETRIQLFENNITELSFPREKDEPIREKILLSYRGKGNWAVLDGMKNCWSKKEKGFVYEPMPSNRDDDFLKDCRFSFEEGLEIIRIILSNKGEQ